MIHCRAVLFTALVWTPQLQQEHSTTVENSSVILTLPLKPHGQLLQRWAEHPGYPPVPSVWPGRSSIWQISETLMAVGTEPASPCPVGNPAVFTKHTFNQRIRNIMCRSLEKNIGNNLTIQYVSRYRGNGTIYCDTMGAKYWVFLKLFKVHTQYCYVLNIRY